MFSRIPSFQHKWSNKPSIDPSKRDSFPCQLTILADATVMVMGVCWPCRRSLCKCVDKLLGSLLITMIRYSAVSGKKMMDWSAVSLGNHVDGILSRSVVVVVFSLATGISIQDITSDMGIEWEYLIRSSISLPRSNISCLGLEFLHSSFQMMA